MANRPDLDDDDDFSELYKEYTGPPVPASGKAQEIAKPNKRSHAGSDDEEEPPDPNAVPTDFTSREAKFWEAKSKATEKNWKKRKEEEMICKICGESGHFTQGCPSTLGANRKSQDFFERVPARDKNVRALFSEKVISKIEKDIGCKIKMDEKFIIVSGKDRLILAKGVDAVHKTKEEAEKKGFSSSHLSKSRSPDRRRSPERKSPVSARLGQSDYRRSNNSAHNASHFQERANASAHNASQFQERYGRQEKAMEDHVREDLRKLTRSSEQAYENDRTRGRSSHSKSPARLPHAAGNSYNSHDSGHGQSRGVYRTEGWNADRQGSTMQSAREFDCPPFPQMFEELELEYKRESTDLARLRDKEEDEENTKHREAVKELRESYLKNLAILRAKHAKEWEEFLQLDARRRQPPPPPPPARQQPPHPGFDDYRQPSYSEYGSPAANHSYPVPGGNLPIHPRAQGNRYPNIVENYPAPRSQDSYGDYQHQRREDYGKAYNRY